MGIAKLEQQENDTLNVFLPHQVNYMPRPSVQVNMLGRTNDPIN